MPRRLPFAVIPIAMAITLVLAGAAPARAGFVWDHELAPATLYTGSLAEHIKSPGCDGGLLGLGWRRGDVSLLATMIGRNVLSVNGDRDDRLWAPGLTMRIEQRLTSWAWSSLRLGAGYVALVGPVPTTLETSRGWETVAGARVSARLFEDDGVDVLFVAELLGERIWLYPDGGKRIDGFATSALVGFEVGGAR